MITLYFELYVKEKEYRALVMDLLGPSLGNFLDYCGKFSIKTILMLADQMIERLMALHNRGHVHGDLKEDNFIMGKHDTADEKTVFLVDFGLAKKYRQGNRHIKFQSGLRPFGTLKYSSLNATLGNQISRRDDLESLAYLLIFLHRGSLPWSSEDVNVAEGDEKLLKIREAKLRTPVTKLCEGLPPEFLKYITYCRKLHFHEDPNYDHLRMLFYNAMRHLNYEDDSVFDWTIKLKEDSEQRRLLTLDDMFF